MLKAPAVIPEPAQKKATAPEAKSMPDAAAPAVKTKLGPMEHKLRRGQERVWERMARRTMVQCRTARRRMTQPAQAPWAASLHLEQR